MSLSALLFASALAIQPAQQSGPNAATQVDDVVVNARAVGDQVRDFISEIAIPERNLRTARWHDSICVGVVNLRGESAQFVADRISQIALDIGLNPGEPGCKPNILIMGTNDGAGLAKGLVEERRRVFLPGGTGMNRTRAALQAFQEGDAAVRWWHISVPVDSHTGKIAVRLPGEEPPQITGTASRLRTEVRNDLNRVIVILDLTKLDGLNFMQVADYAAMVAFSQVDPDADFSGYDSILSLLDDGNQVAGITDWDMAYLKALYSAELTSVSKVHQQGEIAALMQRVEVRQRRNEANTQVED